QLQSSEQSTSPGVAEHLRLQFPVGIGGGMAAHRPGGHTGIGSQFELAAEQVLHAIVVHDEHDQIHRLGADLQTETAALDAKECRGTPTLRSAATGHAASVTGAHNEPALEQGRHYRYTLG